MQRRGPNICVVFGMDYSGVETLKVTEEQQCFTVGNRFTIRSDPKIEHPTGFNTKAEMVLALSENGKGSTVYITATLECKAAVWGVQGIILLDFLCSILRVD